jgi:hypothetical protein
LANFSNLNAKTVRIANHNKAKNGQLMINDLKTVIGHQLSNEILK